MERLWVPIVVHVANGDDQPIRSDWQGGAAMVDPSPSPIGSRWGHWRARLRRFAVAVALVLVFVPAGQWGSAEAKTVVDTDAPVARTPVAATAARATEAAPATGGDYAAREASARKLESFEGGDTTVVLGGSALVIILIVILIIVLI
jgi:hypothetical protein